MALLLESQNLPFTVALAIMIIIAVMEGTSLVLGVGLTHVLDKMIPSIDFNGPETPELTNTSGMTKFLGWLRIGKVPILVTFILFLTAFGILGLILQSLVHGMTGSLLPGLVASVPVFLITLPILRVSHGVVAKVIPKDETYAVSEATFIGRVAVITGGTATDSRGAEARLKDEFGKEHYVMVKPDNEGETFPPGTSVLLVARNGIFFRAIHNPNPNLIDTST
jgi:hypothetical protein